MFGGEKFLPEPGNNDYKNDIPGKLKDYIKNMSAKEI